MHFSRKIESCQFSPIRKFAPYAEAAKARGINIIPLNIGQPDIETPREFYEAVCASKERTLSYCASNGVPEYLDAVRSYYAGFGVKLQPGEVLATNGGSEAAQMALLSILNEGDEVLSPEPFYTNYITFAKLAGGVFSPIPTYAEEGFRYADRERIEPLINERTRAILITNPGNPTGAVITRDELRMIASLAKEHGLFLICDEVYREFVYNDIPLSSALEFEEFSENVIVIDSVSKRFSACGARIGTLISRNKEFMANVLKICQCRLCSPTLDQKGAAAMYGIGQEYYDAVRTEYKSRRDALMERLTAIPGVICRMPEGAFYVMAKLPIDDAERFQKWLLEDFELDGDTVMMTPGEGFYATPGRGRDEVRMAYVIEKDRIIRAMEVLKKALEIYNSAR